MGLFGNLLDDDLEEGIGIGLGIGAVKGMIGLANGISKGVASAKVNANASTDNANTPNAVQTQQVNTTDSSKPTNVALKCQACGAPLSGISGEQVKCQYCDTIHVL